MSTTLAHSGLPPGVSRFELLRLFEQVGRPGYGLSSTAIALVRLYVLKTMDGDYLRGRICAVWSQACRYAEALGLTPRSVNSAERELERAGFIVRAAGINGGRTGDRHEGVITWAAGINLAPLVDRFAELKAKAEALELKARAINQCRAEIRQLGKRIREAGDERLQARVDGILPGGRTARIGCLSRLVSIREALSAMLNAIESEPEPDPRAPKSSGASEANYAPVIRTHQSSRRGTPRGGGDPLERITPRMALSVATEGYRGLVAALGGPSWPNLVEASWRSCGRLGIGQGAWGKACQAFGRERAALCVLLIDRNAELPPGHGYRVVSPGRCLSGMVRRAKFGGVNLVGMFRASQREAGQGAAQHAPQPSLDALAPPEQGPLAHLTAKVMASLAQRVGALVDEVQDHRAPDIPPGDRS